MPLAHTSPWSVPWFAPSSSGGDREEQRVPARGTPMAHGGYFRGSNAGLKRRVAQTSRARARPSFRRFFAIVSTDALVQQLGGELVGLHQLADAEPRGRRRPARCGRRRATPLAVVVELIRRSALRRSSSRASRNDSRLVAGKSGCRWCVSSPWRRAGRLNGRSTVSNPGPAVTWNPSCSAPGCSPRGRPAAGGVAGRRTGARDGRCGPGTEGGGAPVMRE